VKISPSTFFSQNIDSIFSIKGSKTEYFPLLLSSQIFCKISPRKKEKENKKNPFHMGTG
jgi:hypothetical protein